MRVALIVAILVAASALAGCGGDGGSAGGPAAPAGELTGRQWVLDTAALGVSSARNVSSWIQFDQERVAGNDGCNQFSGPYVRDGSMLTLGPLAATQIGCVGPAEDVARRVASALDSVESYAISAATLNLRDSSGDTVLRYRESIPGVDGAWKATSVLFDDAIRSVIPGTELTADFGAAGLSGSAGCNAFRGPYEADGKRLRIGPLARTRKLCRRPEGIAEQERRYLAALQSAVRFEQVGDRLTLLNSAGQMVVTLER